MDAGNLPLPPCPLDASQAADLLQQLQSPVTDVPVLIPAGRQAFWAGRLVPERLPGTNEEVVRLKNKSESRPVTISQARAWLETKALPASEETPPTGATNPEMPLPLFDIQEEFDESGKPIRASAVNITKQLEYLMKQSGDAKENDREEIVMPPSATTVANEGLSARVAPGHSESPKKIVSDAEYQRLSDRLDELARLEEAETSQLKVSKVRPKSGKSKPSSSSSGFSKGFLLNKKPKKPPPKPAASKPPSTETPKEMSGGDKRISFGPNQTKEIPRVGTKPLPPKPKVPPQSSLVADVHERTPIPERAHGRRSDAKSKPAVPKKLSRFALERQQVREGNGS